MFWHWLLQSSPAQMHPCRTTGLIVLQPHTVVALAQGDISLECGHLGILPGLDEQTVIYPQPRSIIYAKGEVVGACDTLAGAENSDVLPWPSVAVVVTYGPVSPPDFVNVQLPTAFAVVLPS